LEFTDLLSGICAYPPSRTETNSIIAIVSADSFFHFIFIFLIRAGTAAISGCCMNSSIILNQTIQICFNTTAAAALVCALQ
jgi:hypothetical protein